MLDHFLPFETGAGDGKVRSTASVEQIKATEYSKENHQTRYNANLLDGSALWSHEASILSIRWNSCNGLENAPWLASGTVCGLVRIDWLQGRWFRDAIPYTSIPNIRFEGQSLEGHKSDSE
jgi:transcription factor C subunit 6